MAWVVGTLWLIMLWGMAAGAEDAQWESYTNTAKAALSQGQYAEAEQQFLAALKVATDFAPDDPRLATSFSNLAMFYHTQDDYAHAESLYQRLLELLERVLGPTHPQVADVLERYAALLRTVRPVRSLFPWSAAAKMTARAERIRQPEIPETASPAGVFSDSQSLTGRWSTDEEELFGDQ
jgi:tetratricopeptide (TPR) repeat protein